MDVCGAEGTYLGVGKALGRSAGAMARRRGSSVQNSPPGLPCGPVPTQTEHIPGARSMPTTAWWGTVTITRISQTWQEAQGHTVTCLESHSYKHRAGT